MLKQEKRWHKHSKTYKIYNNHKRFVGNVITHIRKSIISYSRIDLTLNHQQKPCKSFYLTELSNYYKSKTSPALKRSVFQRNSKRHVWKSCDLQYLVYVIWKEKNISKRIYNQSTVASLGHTVIFVCRALNLVSRALGLRRTKQSVRDTKASTRDK